ALADHHYAGVGHRVALAVAFEVHADLGALRDPDVLVDDGVADDRVAADVDALHQHRALDVGPGVHAHVGRQDRVFHQAAGDDGTRRHHRADRAADPLLMAV